MNSIKYSVITPNYNSFHLMDKYFNSFEMQNYNDFEIIVIDDCSTDNSYIRLLEYAEKSNLNITVKQTNKNSGPGNARNVGIDVSCGEWIVFVDNDDWVEEKFFEKLNDIVLCQDVNCVIFNYFIKKDSSCKYEESMFVGDEGHISLSNCLKWVRNPVAGKAYRSSLLKKNRIYFPDFRRCEDIAFVPCAIEACRSVYYIKTPLYYYYQRSNSLSNNRKLDETDLVRAFSILEERLLVKYPEEIKERSVYDLLYGGVLVMCKAGKSRKHIINYIKDYEKKYPDWMKYETVSKVGILKRVFLICVKLRAIEILKLLSYIHSKMIG